MGGMGCKLWMVYGVLFSPQICVKWDTSKQALLFILMKCYSLQMMFCISMSRS